MVKNLKKFKKIDFFESNINKKNKKNSFFDISLKKFITQ